MKKTHNSVLVAGISAIIYMAGSASPALGECIKKNPLFGFDVFLADKHCADTAIKKKAVKKRSPNVVRRKQAQPVMAAKSDARILKMQTMLASMGYNPGPVDGYMGPQTKKAAGEFNISNDLPEKASTSSTIAVLTGLMGNHMSPEPMKPVAVAAAPQKAVKAAAPSGDARVRKLQMLLANMGYNPGPANGVNTPATRKAAGEFNVANDLPEKASASSTIAVLTALRGNH